MTEPEFPPPGGEVRAHAMPAGASGGAHGETPEAGVTATEFRFHDPAALVEVPARGNPPTFRTDDHEPGTNYPPVLPLPAEYQHELGLHSAADEAEAAALEAAGSRQALQGDEGPHVDLSREG